MSCWFVLVETRVQSGQSVLLQESIWLMIYCPITPMSPCVFNGNLPGEPTSLDQSNLLSILITFATLWEKASSI